MNYKCFTNNHDVSSDTWNTTTSSAAARWIGSSTSCTPRQTWSWVNPSAHSQQHCATFSSKTFNSQRFSANQVWLWPNINNAKHANNAHNYILSMAQMRSFIYSNWHNTAYQQWVFLWRCSSEIVNTVFRSANVAGVLVGWRLLSCWLFLWTQHSQMLPSRPQTVSYGHSHGHNRAISWQQRHRVHSRWDKQTHGTHKAVSHAMFIVFVLWWLCVAK